MSRLFPALPCLTCCLALCVPPLIASAIDGSNMSMSMESTAMESGGMQESMESTPAIEAPSYYESLLSVEGAAALESTEPGLPETLSIHDSAGSVSYAPGKRSGAWKLRLRDLDRPHERVDAVYQMIAVLPLPFDDQGEARFETRSIGIGIREGTAESSVPLIYGGEKIVLKRNVTLEKTLLPGLIGADSEPDKLPSLAGTGYDYTLWDTIVRYDPNHGDTLQVLADVPYSADDDVAAPDARDERLKAYVLTWIPGMDPRYPVFTIRIDVEDPAE